VALAAIALSVPALSDQAGEARNDIVGIFFLLAGVAMAISLRCSFAANGEGKEQRSEWGGWAVVGLAAGLAAGTKLNFLLPAAALLIGFALIAPRGARWRALSIGTLGALAGGGYWYLRNLIHSGNPLPWVKRLGPIDLPAPDQALGGREAHSVLGYLTDGSVWSDWFLPGLHDGLSVLWPLLAATALAGLFLNLTRRTDPALRVAAVVGLAAAFAWLIAPTSASGPDGMPRGFESGLRYLTPALVLGLALLPMALPHPLTSSFGSPLRTKRRSQRMGWGVVGVLLVVGLGFPAQRHYLEHRYADPSFAAPGLNAAFRWAQAIDHARIATTSTRQYPLYGRDLGNEVDFIGEEHPHGGFIAPKTCPQWRRLLNKGGYDYVITSRDRIEPKRPTYPATARWTKAPSTAVVLQMPPTIIYKLRTPLDPSGCPTSRE
jgi:hypothetical protein